MVPYVIVYLLSIYIVRICQYVLYIYAYSAYICENMCFNPPCPSPPPRMICHECVCLDAENLSSPPSLSLALVFLSKKRSQWKPPLALKLNAQWRRARDRV